MKGERKDAHLHDLLLQTTYDASDKQEQEPAPSRRGRPQPNRCREALRPRAQVDQKGDEGADQAVHEQSFSPYLCFDKITKNGYFSASNTEIFWDSCRSRSRMIYVCIMYIYHRYLEKIR